MLSAILAISLAADPLPEAKRVLVLGDSITAAGLYTAYLEGYFATHYPDRPIEFINLGLPSETITGLSEPSHPWPRPNVHERLDRALTMLKPDVVIACYGMNDGIYHPFALKRFAKFQDGVLKLVSRCRDDGIRVFLLTPPYFDSQPVRETLKPLNVGKFGWKSPYERYQEDVLVRYGAWEKQLDGVGFTTIDVMGPLFHQISQARGHGGQPGYVLATDGVHMNADGHAIIANHLLRAWEAPVDTDEADVNANGLVVAKGNVTDFKREAGSIRLTWSTRLPMPIDPSWSESVRKISLSGVGYSRHHLIVRGLETGRYHLYEGNRAMGTIEVERGVAVVDMQKFPELSTNQRAERIGKLLRERERIMSPAWLDHVGHKRPDTPKGLPLDEARKKAEPITAEIRRLAAPRAIELRIMR